MREKVERSRRRKRGKTFRGTMKLAFSFFFFSTNCIRNGGIMTTRVGRVSSSPASYATISLYIFPLLLFSFSFCFLFSFFYPPYSLYIRVYYRELLTALRRPYNDFSSLSATWVSPSGVHYK